MSLYGDSVWVGLGRMGVIKCLDLKGGYGNGIFRLPGHHGPLRVGRHGNGINLSFVDGHAKQTSVPGSGAQLASNRNPTNNRIALKPKTFPIFPS